MQKKVKEMQSPAYAHLIGPQFVYFTFEDDDDDDDKSRNKREKRILFMDLAMICFNPKIDATRQCEAYMR